jgi:hypothetical protein
LSIRRQISQSILDRLKHGQYDGDVPKTGPIAALAAYFSTVLHGLALQSRNGASRKTLTQLVEIAIADCKRWLDVLTSGGHLTAPPAKSKKTQDLRIGAASILSIAMSWVSKKNLAPVRLGADRPTISISE